MALVRQTRTAGQTFDGTAGAGLFDTNGAGPVSRALQTRINSVAFSTASPVGFELVRVSPEGDEVTLFQGVGSTLYVQGLILPTSDDGVYYTLQVRSLVLGADAVLTYDYDVIGTEQ